MLEARTEVDIDATPDQVWDVIVDLEGYPSWSKIHKSVTVLSRHEDGGWPELAELTTKIAGIKETQTIRYTWYDDRVTWELVKGGIQRAQVGEAVVSDNGDGTTKVVMTGGVDLIIPVPSKVVQLGQKAVINVATKGLKQAVEQRRRT